MEATTTLHNAIRLTTPAPRDVWQQLMQSDSDALPYQSPEWFDCILHIGNYKDASRLYEMPDGRFLLMPLVRHPYLPIQFSPPHGWGMGGLLSSSEIYPEDITAIFEDLRQNALVRTSIRPNPRQGDLWEAGRPDWVTAVPRYAHIIELSENFDDIWMGKMSKKMRKTVRKAERHPQLTAEWDNTGRLIPTFYDLLLKSIDQWSAQQNEPLWLAHWRGKRRDPYEKFVKIAERLGPMCRVYMAYRDGVPVASSITLQGANVNDSRGAMDKGLAGQTGANYMIQKLAIEEACKAGCRYYHLGESSPNSGLAQYKERFGAVGHPYFQYHIEKLPITKADKQLRTFVKNMIGFKDA